MVKVTQKFLQCRTMDFLLSHLVRNTIGWIPLQPNKHVKALVWQANTPFVASMTSENTCSTTGWKATRINEDKLIIVWKCIVNSECQR